jgi:hypothetical protein
MNDHLDSVGEPYTGESLPAAGRAIEAGAAALPDLHKKIDQYSKIERGTSVFDVVRFLAPIVPKCFT